MRRWSTVGAIGLAAVFVAANTGAATAYFYDASKADVIARGVTVAGVDLGGLSRGEAATQLDRVLQARLGRPLSLRYGDRTFTVDAREAGLDRVDIDAMIAGAVAASREGGLLHRVVREVRGAPVAARIDLAATTDPTLTHAAVDRVAAAIDRPARAASVVPGPSSLRAVPARWGLAVRRTALAVLVRRALLDPSAPRAIDVPVRSLRPAVTTAALPRKYATFLTVDREHFQLTLWKHLHRAKTYRIAVGRAGLETPAGLYRIDDKQIDPSWHVPKSAWAGSLAGRVIPPGPDDPIKARWMGFWNGAGVHGTDDVASLGSAASHGCVRMAIPDVEELYDQVPLGTPIYVG